MKPSNVEIQFNFLFLRAGTISLRNCSNLCHRQPFWQTPQSAKAGSMLTRLKMGRRGYAQS